MEKSVYDKIMMNLRRIKYSFHLYCRWFRSGIYG